MSVEFKVATDLKLTDLEGICRNPSTRKIVEQLVLWNNLDMDSNVSSTIA